MAKKLQIHKCLRANGTIAFQEEKCNKVTKPQAKIQKQIPVKKKSSTKKPQQISPVKSTKYKTIQANHQINAAVRNVTISMAVFKNWQIFEKVFDNKFWHVKIKNKRLDDSFSVIIDFIYPDNQNFNNHQLIELLSLVSSHYIKGSEQNGINIQTLSVNNGRGFLVSFTNSEAEKHYRHISKGVIFKNKWLIQFSIQTQKLNSSSFQQLLNALTQSINIKPKSQ